MAYISNTRAATDLITYVKRQFGDESGVQVTDADIIRWINAGQDEIFRRNKPIKAVSTADFTSGVSEYTFPSNVLFVQSLRVDGRPIPVRSFEEAEEYALVNDPKGVSTGDPEFWYEFGGTFNFYPKPDKTIAGGITIYYIKAPTPVVNATDILSIPDTYYNRLIEFVMSQIYELDENLEASQLKTSQFMSGIMEQANEDGTVDDVYPRITVLIEDM